MKTFSGGILIAASLLGVVACGGGGGGGGSGGGTGLALSDLSGEGQEVVLFFGDSITRGEGDGPGARTIPDPAVGGFPARFHGITGIDFVNAGERGETSDQGAARIGQILPGSNADDVVIAEGINDLTPRQDIDTIRNLRSIVGTVKANGRLPVLTTIYPVCCNYADRVPISLVARVNDRIRALAAEQAVPLIDVFAAYFPRDPATPDAPLDFSGFSDASGLIYEEGLHPTPLGHEFIAEVIAAAFEGDAIPLPPHPATVPTT